MKTNLLFCLLFLSTPFFCSAVGADEPARLAALDAYWAEVSRTVGEGDFAGYKATCHPEGVLVAGTSKACYPLAKALKNWKQDFVDTASGKKKGSVVFQFSQRLGDETTAHETGMFKYATVGENGEKTAEYIHFEGLLVKREGAWKIMMEYQKSKGTEEEWKALVAK